MEEKYNCGGIGLKELKQKLKNDFNVTLEEISNSTIHAPTGVLHFKDEHTPFIERNPEVYDLKFFKTKAEGIAHINNWTLPFNIIEGVSALKSRPYSIEIRAIEPLVLAFVVAILNE